MAQKAQIGTPLNTNSEAESFSVSVNSSTAQILVPANLNRISVWVSNPSNKKCWIRFRSAGSNNDQDGIFLKKETWEQIITSEDKYTGEISVIMDSGGTKEIFATEF